MNDSILINAVGLHKSFDEGGLAVRVLDSINICVNTNETVVIIGASGAGKSTLLHLLGGVALPDQGEVYIAGKNLSKLSEKERGNLRNRRLGFVYQFHHLLSEFTALENIAMPLLVGRQPKDIAMEEARSLLIKIGLGQRGLHKPSELSGGERQRVAIARALIATPVCVFADEPTGNLDENTARQVFDLMLELNKQYGTSLVLVTHNKEFASRADRVYELKAGRLVDLAGD